MSNLRWVLVTRSGARAVISSTRRPRYARGSFSLTVTRPSPGCNRTRAIAFFRRPVPRSEEHTSELQSHSDIVCRLLLEKKKKTNIGSATDCDLVATQIRV